MELILVLLGTMVAMLGLFMPSLLTFDFRADLDRMEVLKTLPLPAWRIVVGQLLAPVLLVTVVQIVMLAALQVVLGAFEPLLLAAPPFMLSFNFFVFGVENLIFLWFPTRQLAATPGDLQNFVRVMVLWLVKLMLLMVIFGIGGALAVIAYFIAGDSYVAAGITAWLCVTLCALGIVPLLCLAFDRFDVAADTPP
jgi:hypothetical protein